MDSKKWKYVGRSGENQEVADILNRNAIGSFASISAAANEETFTIWGNKDQSSIITGYAWLALGESSNDDDVAALLKEYKACGAAVSLNRHDTYVVWGYIPRPD